MARHVPTGGLAETLDIAYGDEGARTRLDVFSPEPADGALPTVVWIHGGAWISGDKVDVRPYVRRLAHEGFTTIAVSYPLAPERTYPASVTSLNAALGHVLEHADELRVDPSRIVVAGDSAGANLTSQLATAVTNRGYAEETGLQPALTPAQLRGVVLNCGIYDVSSVPEAPGLGGWGFRIALWAYLGRRVGRGSPGGQLLAAHEMSTLEQVTADFPATWISGGNGDPLTTRQSKALAARLERLGVDCTAVFYADDVEPALPHEYQFHLDLPAARDAYGSTLSFLRRVLR
ncbi:alpha/beta hydrolase [Nocardioides panacihumi]|uniref:Alpha/beta hydrolase n=2 Tax=Nocardioides panacihumi TaxID=400774 RepID=A0ABN2QEG8_9ACTN